MKGPTNGQAFSYVPEPISSEIDSHFASFPWYSAIRDDPTYLPIQTVSRTAKPGTENAFLNETLRTSTTILACQSFWREPSRQSTTMDKVDFGEMVTLYSVGHGLDGHENVAHGGFVALLLDEVMGLLVRLYRGVRDPYTVSLKIDYKKPLMTPGAVVCRSWFTKMEGRKLWTESTVEDGQAAVFASGQATWVDIGARI